MTSKVTNPKHRRNSKYAPKNAPAYAIMPYSATTEEAFAKAKPEDTNPQRPVYSEFSGKQSALPWKNLLFIIESKNRVTVLVFQSRTACMAYKHGSLIETVSVDTFWTKVDKKSVTYYDISQNVIDNVKTLVNNEW